MIKKYYSYSSTSAVVSGEVRHYSYAATMNVDELAPPVEVPEGDVTFGGEAVTFNTDSAVTF